MDAAGSYSVARRAGLFPTELTGMWGWILLRSPHQGRGSAPAPAPAKQIPAPSAGVSVLEGRPVGPTDAACAKSAAEGAGTGA